MNLFLMIWKKIIDDCVLVIHLCWQENVVMLLSKSVDITKEIFLR